MTARNLRKRSNTLRVKHFLRRLDNGELLDHTKKIDSNHRPVVKAPKAMVKREH